MNEIDEISLFLAFETIEHRKYLKNFFKSIDELKLNSENKNKKNVINAYKIGIEQNPKFWNEIYNEEPLSEEKCDRKYIRIGEQYQANIPLFSHSRS